MQIPVTNKKVYVALEFEAFILTNCPIEFTGGRKEPKEFSHTADGHLQQRRRLCFFFTFPIWNIGAAMEAVRPKLVCVGVRESEEDYRPYYCRAATGAMRVAMSKTWWVGLTAYLKTRGSCCPWLWVLNEQMPLQDNKCRPSLLGWAHLHLDLSILAEVDDLQSRLMAP
ncbi:complex I intermediate-associated protein 30 [Striga asiatica]|uniref:Complex I intermediate-associated protein 30 n=1 Tax=Striga asiatica TaxID=4170 RepID=A0A5A7QU74_STRAF|nr:complex I intermediate-associated protein 30 [Striga asiatica]